MIKNLICTHFELLDLPDAPASVAMFVMQDETQASELYELTESNNIRIRFVPNESNGRISVTFTLIDTEECFKVDSYHTINENPQLKTLYTLNSTANSWGVGYQQTSRNLQYFPLKPLYREV